MQLTPFFVDQEVPPQAQQGAVLQRFPSDREDFHRIDEADPRLAAAFRESVLKRKVVSVLEVEDLNRDGWATEFVLQVGVLPCGKRQSILIGVSPKRRVLHAFGTAEHPDTPLVLDFDQWKVLGSSKGTIRLVSWTCGDHGSERQTELVVSIDEAGIHVLREQFTCDPPGEHGERLSREHL